MDSLLHLCYQISRGVPAPRGTKTAGRGTMKRHGKGRFLYAAASALIKLAFCSPVEPQIVPPARA